jgi:acid phosphatase
MRSAAFRLDQALADKSWTAAPAEQKGEFADLPPAVVLDVDETVLDNFALPGLDDEERQDLQHQDLERVLRRQGVARHPGCARVHEVRRFQGREGLLRQQPRAEVEQSTRENMEKLGFPMGGNVDTFLMQNEKRTGAAPRARVAR